MKFSEKLDVIKQEFYKRAPIYDELSVFPIENYELICELDLHNLNLGYEYGGEDLGVKETCDFLIEIGSSCSSTALSLAMHYYSLGAFKSIFDDEQKDRIFKEVQTQKVFFGSVNDPDIYFIKNANELCEQYSLFAEKVPGGYIINGVKPYVSGSPKVRYLPLYSYQASAKKGVYKLSLLIADLEADGVSIDNSWDYAALKASETNNIYFKNVFVPQEQLVGEEGKGVEQSPSLIYWFRLSLSAVYQGIAKQAYQYILEKTKQKIDRFSKKPLSIMPNVQYHLADMKIKLEVSYSQLTRCAIQADEEEKKGICSEELYKQSLITQNFITKTANEIVWLAMQIEGMSSLNIGSTLERLYRDVRAATFHPPNSDLSKELLAKKELGLIMFKNRWC
ncbi:hypothetical protein COJ27_29825 [Bacillus cereus]|uniref:acyl-CoA dehydrogenase family protein n=1 Tax=Bacillus cereus TaxID=1396 RepID=UPI000BF9345A|nr:acyl-CoA dehydrogenase family protein [Bacillus cereus]PFL57202.1 hypothetical protein COJ27_29825 [Bacillus cereus]